jgi:hypothetical protein
MSKTVPLDQTPTTITRGQHRAGVGVDHENRDRNDFYVTPESATEALLRVEQFTGKIWEPASGDGAIAKVLQRHGHDVLATDLVQRGFVGAEARIDFLMEWFLLAPNIITNPPFKMCQEFAEHALDLGCDRLALLLRLAFLEGKSRRKFFDERPPARVWVFSERVTMWRRGVANAHAKGMVPFCWIVWDKGFTGRPTVGWVP